MINISVSSNIDEILRRWEAKAKQVPFAIAVGLTKTAKDVQAATVREMADVFDRPTPYTLSSVYVRRATKAKLQAEVGLKEDEFTGSGTAAAKFLLPHIAGGGRRLKRFEAALRSVGALPAGMVAVPGKAAQLDGYGNMSRGQIVQIISYFRAFPEAGFRANITAARRAKLAKGTKSKRGMAYFVGRPADGKLPLGIWQRTSFGALGSAIKPIMIFVDWANYKAIFEFPYVARMTAEAAFPRHFDEALRQAMATAR